MQATALVNYSKITLVFFVSLLISLTWLVFPYLIQGQRLLENVGDQSRLTKAGNVSLYLTRRLVQSPELDLTATYANTEFFQYVDQASTVGELRPDQNYIFLVTENIHRGSLTTELPEASLHIGDQVFLPSISSGPSQAEHHRLTLFSFPKLDERGRTINPGENQDIRLYVSNFFMGSQRKMSFVGTWEAPFELPEELTSRADIAPVATLALGAGLLSSVLTPCLLQLVVIFGSIVGGYSTVPGQSNLSSAQLSGIIRSKVMQIAFAFVLGFTLLYMFAGAVIGAVGHQAQLVFAEYSRTVAIISGIVVICMGIWTGIRGSSSYACRVLDQRSLKIDNVRDLASVMAISMGYALGCTACFGGAIVATLVIYVGAIGSASVGAAIMLCFSIGVAIPFLLSAFYISRMQSALSFFAEHSRKISLLSMVIIIAFGLILITDNFHFVSSLIYPYLGLHPAV